MTDTSNSKPLHVDRLPCSTCPYRRDTPSGVWAPSEYAKLPLYDDNDAFGIFLCHHTNSTGRETVCRGWLTVHCESAAARLAELQGFVTGEQRYADVDTPLYSTGREACDAGMADVPDPSPAAQRAVDRLVKKGSGRV